MLFGDSLIVNVNTAAAEAEPVWSLLGYFDGFKASGSRDVQKKPVFGRSTPVKRMGNRDLSFSLAGYLAPEDESQQVVAAAEKAGETVQIQVLFDGANGFECSAYIASFDLDVSADDFQSIGYECEVDGETTIVGTGPAL
jgi:hypothetical protein